MPAEISTSSYNNSSNDDSAYTTVTSPLSWPLWLNILFGAIVTLAIIISVVGNVLTIAAFCGDRKLRRCPQNVYVINLAVTDLLVGFSSMPFYASYTLRGFHWAYSAAFCKAWLTIDFWVCAESSVTVILISYDRLLMVRDGLLYNQTQTPARAFYRVLLTWLLSFCLYGPAILGFDIWRGYSTVEEGDCDVEFASVLWYTLLTALLEFVVPFVLLGAFSGLLYANIARRSRVAERPGHLDPRAGQLRKDVKAARSLAALISTYAVCWTPYTVATVVLAVCETCVNQSAYEAFTWLLWINSSLNPFLYAFTNARFKAHFRRVLCMCWRRAAWGGNKVVPLSMELKDNTVDSAVI